MSFYKTIKNLFCNSSLPPPVACLVRSEVDGQPQAVHPPHSSHSFICLRSACGAAESKQKVGLFKRILFSSLFDFGIWELIIGIDRQCIPFQVVTGYQGDANSQWNKSGQQPGAKVPGKLRK